MNCNSNNYKIIDTDGVSCINSCIPSEINVVCKEIIIPIGQDILAVQNENKSESRTFIIPKVTENEEDLSDKDFYINIKNSNNEINKIKIETLEILDNYIKLNWTLDILETSVAGDLEVQIEATSNDYNWKTFPATFKIISAII